MSPARAHSSAGDGAVDAAAHGHQRAPAGRGLELPARADGRAERPGQRVAGDLRGVQLAGAEPAELGGDLARADAGGVEHRLTADQRDRGASGGGRRAAAVRLEPGVGDRGRDRC